MKKWFGKKYVVLAALVLALGAAVYLNYSLAGDGLSVQTGGDAETPKSGTTASGENLGDSRLVNTTAADYFTTARSNREKARKESLSILQEVLEDKSKAKDVLAQSAQKVTAIAQAVTQEDKIESLVKAKGFADCVAYLEDDHCNVVVKGKELTEAQTVQILEIVTAQSKVDAKNVSISAVNS